MKTTGLAWKGYLVAVHLALAAVVVSTGTVGKIAQHLGLREPERSPQEWMSAMHRQLDAEVPAGAVVFLGDSLTDSLVTAKVAPLSVNFGTGGWESADLLREIGSYRSLSRARAVVITIGTNDLLDGRAEGLAGRYRAILAKVPAGVPVVMSSIPPIERPGLKDAARRAALDAQAACAADPRCRFVDLFSALEGKPGMLWDGVHLTAQGYAIWSEQLRAELAPAKGRPGSP